MHLKVFSNMPLSYLTRFSLTPVGKLDSSPDLPAARCFTTFCCMQIEFVTDFLRYH